MRLFPKVGSIGAATRTAIATPPFDRVLRGAWNQPGVSEAHRRSTETEQSTTRATPTAESDQRRRSY